MNAAKTFQTRSTATMSETRKGTMALAAIAAMLMGTWAGDAQALSQPGGATIPAEPGCHAAGPTGLAATFACVCRQPGLCNIGAVCASPGSCDDGQNSQCETTLWHSFNDNTCIPSNLSGLDPQVEASVVPETFRPTCAQTFSLLSRGTARFQDAFGWYNVTGSKPAASDLHVMLSCSAARGSEVVLDLQTQPAYRGGDIGFFLVTPESLNNPSDCSSGDCCASVARAQAGNGQIYYSERKYNPDSNGASSLIHLLTYQSHLDNNTFYFAWEDIFGGSNNDFTDLVTGVSGLHCAGGGQACDTGNSGLCGRGITVCEQGTLTCSAVFTAEAETCNGLDDNCDGKTDNGAICPSAGEVCHQGRCVAPCDRGEFPCLAPSVCDTTTKLCVDAACVDITCPDDKTCRGGDCVAPCEGVICPHGQQCVGDKCVDLCSGIRCESGQACVEGKCVAGCAQCGGITCEAPLNCNAATGSCGDPSCPNGCPEGSYCEAGDCVDACQDALCPGGQACVDGHCGGKPDDKGDGHLGAGGGSASGGLGTGASAAAGAESSTGCGCRLPQGKGDHTRWLLLTGLAGGLMWRRRRSARALR